MLNDEHTRKVAQSSVQRVRALALLEDCLYHQSDLLLADLHKYTNLIVSEFLKLSPMDPESVTTINEVTSRPLPIALASPIAIALYELIGNAIQHAFDDAPGTHYLHVVLAPAQPGADYRLSVQDNGRGIPTDINLESPGTAGLTIVASMARKLSGTLTVTVRGGTLASIDFPQQEI
jgi:two-component sensor histidine kinase